jgi:predicted 3-demethylubiquinone-9 3-methyltransferase (glyoxalase superfamily)
MAAKFITHLMFEGKAEEAMNFYVSLFPGSKIHQTIFYQEGAAKGKVLRGLFTLGDREFLCIDTTAGQNMNFTPAISIFVDFDSSEELQNVYAALLEGGEALMPMKNYGFSRNFAWVKDRYGFSWQLNFP